FLQEASIGKTGQRIGQRHLLESFGLLRPFGSVDYKGQMRNDHLQHRQIVVLIWNPIDSFGKIYYTNFSETQSYGIADKRLCFVASGSSLRDARVGVGISNHKR